MNITQWNKFKKPTMITPDTILLQGKKHIGLPLKSVPVAYLINLFEMNQLFGELKIYVKSKYHLR